MSRAKRRDMLCACLPDLNEHLTPIGADLAHLVESYLVPTQDQVLARVRQRLLRVAKDAEALDLLLDILSRTNAIFSGTFLLDAWFGWNSNDIEVRLIVNAIDKNPTLFRCFKSHIFGAMLVPEKNRWNSKQEVYSMHQLTCAATGVSLLQIVSLNRSVSPSDFLLRNMDEIDCLQNFYCPKDNLCHFQHPALLNAQRMMMKPKISWFRFDHCDYNCHSACKYMADQRFVFVDALWPGTNYCASEHPHGKNYHCPLYIQMFRAFNQSVSSSSKS